MSGLSSSLLGYDWTGCQIPGTGLAPDALERIAPDLERARRIVLEEDLAQYVSGNVPESKRPLDAGFVDLPNRILDAYRRDRQGSELGRILKAALRFRDVLDRVVILGIGGSYMGAKALMDTCLHPYHNELPRGQRGSVPRIYFEGNNADNDALHGLLELLRVPDESGNMEPWGIVVISKSGGTLETAAAFRVLLRALGQQSGKDAARIAERVLPVTGQEGKLFELSRALGCQEIFEVPDGVGGRFSVLSAVGLLPAAIMGIDVVRLLEGAMAMNDHFRTAPPGQNVVLQYVGVAHLMETEHLANLRILSVWSKALETLGFWYDQLLAESLGKQERGATPLTVVNTRDLHSRTQQHQEGVRDKLITNVRLESYRCDPIAIGTSAFDQDGLNALAARSYPEIMQGAFAATNQSYRDDGRATATITLRGTDEFSLGQFFQMMMLATVVEGRLIGVNPFGQPGVEGYKGYMRKNLSAMR